MITKHKSLRLKIMRKTKGHPIFFIWTVAIICWVLFISSFSSSMGIDNINSSNKINIYDNVTTTRNNGYNNTSGPMISAVNITPVQPKKDEEIIITCTVTDDSDIAYVKIYYCTASFCTVQMPMDNIEEDKYKHICVPNSLPTGIVEYHIIAKDAVNNTMEYNGTFEISGTSDNSENGESCCGDDSIPGFDLNSIIISVLIITTIFYFKKIKTTRIK